MLNRERQEGDYMKKHPSISELEEDLSEAASCYSQPWSYGG
jgi:hypothetical protein